MRAAGTAGDSETVNEHYDVIIVGSGAGGGTLAHTLARSGKSILLLERGDFLSREMDNWDPRPVFVDGKYISKDTWYDADGKPFQPQVHYFVGGATKMYGAALYRLRPGDFGELKHVDGVSPAWPLTYADFEPWYTRAEHLYHVCPATRCCSAGTAGSGCGTPRRTPRLTAGSPTLTIIANALRVAGHIAGRLGATGLPEARAEAQPLVTAHA